MRASAERIGREIRYLCETIGVRLAGSEAEKQAAEHLRQEFLRYCPTCTIEEYPVMERAVEEERLELRIGGEWKSFNAHLLNSAVSTGGKPLEREVVFFDSHTDYQREDLSFLTDKAVIHYGVHIHDEDCYRRLMEAKPAFLLMVDTRYTSPEPLADGLFPAYVEKYGAVPTMDVAFFDAWQWCTQGADRARLTVTGGSRPGVTRDVAADLPGTDPEGLILYCGAHMDTQAATPGADDNADGTAVLLELARLLSQRPHRHTIRLIVFGAEEQLSVGSASYVRAHRREIEEKGRFMCNFDSCGSAVGWNNFNVNACEPLRQQIREAFNRNDQYYLEVTEPDPFNDHFSFTVAGVPGLTVLRKNCEIGLFYHHRLDNTPDKVSNETVARLTDCAAQLLEELADDPHLTARCRVAEETKTQVQDIWNSIYGGWK